MEKVIKMDSKELIKDDVNAQKTSERNISMPKRDYEATMQNDTIYLDKFNTFIMTGVANMKRLSKKKNISSDVNLMYQYAKIDMEVAEAVSKANVQTRIMNDKKVHFEKIFTPMYNRQVEEMNENWDKTWKEAKTIADGILDFTSVTQKAIIKSISEYESGKYGAMEEEEIKNETYKVLKRVVKLHKEEKNG